MSFMQDSGEELELNPEKPRPMTLEDWHRIQAGQRDAAEERAKALIKLGEELREDRSGWKVLYPLQKDGVDLEYGAVAQYLSLPIKELPFMVQAYVNHIETERTNRLCKCEWIIHPDDVDKPEGSRRIRKGQEHAACPVHTKIGFLLYFFDHYFRTQCDYCPPDCKSCTYDRDCECYTHQPGEHYESEKTGSCICGNEWICPDSHFYKPDSETTQDVTAVLYADEPESPTSRMQTVNLPDGN